MFNKRKTWAQFLYVILYVFHYNLLSSRGYYIFGIRAEILGFDSVPFFSLRRPIADCVS